MGQITLTMKDKPLKKVIKQIEKVSEYRFFYNEDLASLNKPVSLEAQNSSIEKVLKSYGKKETYSLTKIPYRRYKHRAGVVKHSLEELIFFIEKESK
jgi:hypothetical protein